MAVLCFFLSKKDFSGQTQRAKCHKLEFFLSYRNWRIYIYSVTLLCRNTNILICVKLFFKNTFQVSDLRNSPDCPYVHVIDFWRNPFSSFFFQKHFFRSVIDGIHLMVHFKALQILPLGDVTMIGAVRVGRFYHDIMICYYVTLLLWW